MDTQRDNAQPPPSEASKLLMCILFDGQVRKELIRGLRNEKGITRIDSVSCRGVGVVQATKTRHGRLPQSVFMWMVSVVVPEADADAVFDYIYEKARIGREGGGIVLQSPLLGATPLLLPEGVPEEKA